VNVKNISTSVDFAQKAKQKVFLPINK